jgi:hypothetical protein
VPDILLQEVSELAVKQNTTVVGSVSTVSLLHPSENWFARFRSIWNFAVQGDLTMITKDEDFVARCTLLNLLRPGKIRLPFSSVELESSKLASRGWRD